MLPILSHVPSFDPYEFLDIKQSASDKQIENAYKKLVKKYKNKNDAHSKSMIKLANDAVSSIKEDRFFNNQVDNVINTFNIPSIENLAEPNFDSINFHNGSESYSFSSFSSYNNMDGNVIESQNTNITKNGKTVKNEQNVFLNGKKVDKTDLDLIKKLKN